MENMKKEMTREVVLKGNKFANCSYEELKVLWKGLLDFYAKGWVEADNPLAPYKDAYCNESNIGVMLTSQDLLQAIAWKCMEELSFSTESGRERER